MAVLAEIATELEFLLDGVDKLFHVLITSFFLFLFLICWRENENGE